MAEALWGREQPRAYFLYCIEQLLCLEHPSRSAWRWAPRQHSCSRTLGRGAPTTVPQQRLRLHNHWAEDGEKPVCVRACVRARACARSLACHVHGRARVPAGSPGAGACALRGLGVFFAPHMPSSAAAVWIQREGARAFDVCACWALQVFHAFSSVCACVSVRAHACAHVCEISVPAGCCSGCWNPCLPGRVRDEQT